MVRFLFHWLFLLIFFSLSFNGLIAIFDDAFCMRLLLLLFNDRFLVAFL